MSMWYICFLSQGANVDSETKLILIFLMWIPYNPNISYFWWLFFSKVNVTEGITQFDLKMHLAYYADGQWL